MIVQATHTRGAALDIVKTTTQPQHNPKTTYYNTIGTSSRSVHVEQVAIVLIIHIGTSVGFGKLVTGKLKGEHYSKTIFSTVKIYLTTSILAVLFLHKSASFNRKKP